MEETAKEKTGQEETAKENTETLKDTRKHFSRLGAMFVVGTIAITVFQSVVLYLVRVLKPQWLLNGDIVLTVSILPMYLLGMPVLILLVKRIPAQNVEKKKMKWWQFPVAAVMCFGLAYLANLAGQILTMWIGMLKGSAVQNTILDVATSVSVPLAILYMVICAPVMEEYVFRKLIVDRTVRYGQGVSVVLSGLMFALFHGNLNQFVYAFVLGSFFAFLYVKTGKLRITIALHAIFNFVGSVLSIKLVEMVDLDEYQSILSQGTDPAALAAYMEENALGWALMALFGLFVICMILASIILMIVCIVMKKFTFERGQVVIPRGRRFSTVILNVGMLVYCVIWIAAIVIQLFA